MNLVKKYPLLGSSVNPDELSMTVKSVGGWIIAGIMFGAMNFYGIDLDKNELTSVLDNIIVIIPAVMSIYGVIRKAVVWFNNQRIK